MGKYQEEKKTPIIMVKKRALFYPLPYLKKQVLSHVQRRKDGRSSICGKQFSCRRYSSPEASASKKKRKRRRFPRQPHGLMNLLTIAWKKLSLCFPILRRKRGISSTENWHNQ